MTCLEEFYAKNAKAQEEIDKGEDSMADGVTLKSWTPRMPKMMKNVQQMRTMLPMGLREESRVCTTNFSPGARLITLKKVSLETLTFYIK